ncbi:zinc-finger homeodomain protein 1 [Brassica napus]|uniref:zinc-finger homeodomain protein 1 n=1 Tax=Brassica napus TaxID=3708 RepID=UPI002078FB44|nr:zinc-finger homeodomain protein 1 [Brassica napus]
MDFEEEINLHEEEEEDALYDSPPPLPPPSRVLKASTESPDTAGTTSTGEGGFMVVHGGSSLGGGGRFRFRECLKNQAVNIGGHAVDGCGEFMPAGIEGTIEALKCAACGCHRNFHRKESLYFHHHHAPPQQQHHPPPPGFYRLPAPVSYRPPPSQAPPLQLALPQRERSEDRMETSSAEAGGIRKRFRTKFTAEQKERMLGLAERIGWRIQRQDDEVIQRFCQETGVPRQVLKVWLHNNKHTLGKSSSPPLHHHQNPTLPPQSSSFHHERDQP